MRQGRVWCSLGVRKRSASEPTTCRAEPARERQSDVDDDVDDDAWFGLAASPPNRAKQCAFRFTHSMHRFDQSMRFADPRLAFGPCVLCGHRGRRRLKLAQTKLATSVGVFFRGIACLPALATHTDTQPTHTHTHPSTALAQERNGDAPVAPAAGSRRRHHHATQQQQPAAAAQPGWQRRRRQRREKQGDDQHPHCEGRNEREWEWWVWEGEDGAAVNAAAAGGGGGGCVLVVIVCGGDGLDGLMD